MRAIDYDNNVAITREIYWVGYFDAEAHLHCNPYLLIDEKDVVLFDPGSIPHFPIVMRKVIDLVNPADISLVVASHQDPDVCGNLAVLEDVIGRPDLKIAAHSKTIRLIRHFGVNSKFYAVDENDYQFTLSSGRVLDFLYTPYLHSPGAIVTLDRQSRSLFSGDIFGAVSHDWSLFSKGDYLTALDTFHQLYMPSNELLKRGMEQFENLEIDRILPQHGSVLEGGQIKSTIDHLKSLSCGIDLIGR